MRQLPPSFLAASLLALIAAPIDAQVMGREARATIAIRASVMPRFRLSDSPVEAKTLIPALASNAPGLRVRLVDGSDGQMGHAAPQDSNERPRQAPRILLIVPD